MQPEHSLKLAEPELPDIEPPGIEVPDNTVQEKPTTVAVPQSKPAPKPIVTISAKDIPITFSKPELHNEVDVDQYLEQYRSALLAAIQSGKKVRV
jgi:hypothetical protein